LGHDPGRGSWRPQHVTRRIDRTGLIELVELDGTSEDLIEEDLDQFVAIFPVEIESDMRRLGTRL